LNLIKIVPPKYLMDFFTALLTLNRSNSRKISSIHFLGS